MRFYIILNKKEGEIRQSHLLFLFMILLVFKYSAHLLASLSRAKRAVGLDIYPK